MARFVGCASARLANNRHRIQSEDRAFVWPRRARKRRRRALAGSRLHHAMAQSEHISDPRSEILALSRMLQSNGVLLIAVPNAAGLQARLFGRHWLHLDVPRHLYHFNDHSLASLLKLAGLSPVRRWNQEFEYDLLGWSQSALNAMMPNQNVFYRTIVGKRAGLSRGAVLVNAVLGTVFSALSLPAVVAGTAAGRGGTLIVAARRRNQP